jgi:hypothetical protein
MRLPKSEQTLEALLEYLRSVDLDIGRLKITHSTAADSENEHSPRQFCSVACGDERIYCAASLENVDERVRMGILLHEIGHLFLNACNGDESEVDVDVWIVKEFPEARYCYADHKYVRSDGERVTAKNLQRVGSRFVERVI